MAFSPNDIADPQYLNSTADPNRGRGTLYETLENMSNITSARNTADGILGTDSAGRAIRDNLVLPDFAFMQYAPTDITKSTPLVMTQAGYYETLQGGFYDDANPTRLTIPTFTSSVAYVRIEFKMVVYNIPTINDYPVTARVDVKQNGGATFPQVYASSTLFETPDDGVSLWGISPPMGTTPGTYYELEIIHTHEVDTIDANGYMIVQVLR